MKIKTTMRCHLTPVRMAIKKVDNQSMLEMMWRKGNLLALLVGKKVDTPTKENSMEIP